MGFRWSLPTDRYYFALTSKCEAKGSTFWANGTVRRIADNAEVFSRLARFPMLNKHGTVAFVPDLRAGGPGVFTSSAGKIQRAIDTTEEFECTRGALINDADTVLFFATPNGGTLVIYAGPDPINDRVLGLSTPLFGSTVEELAMNPVSINDVDQFAVRVRLEDGRQFILRADPVRHW